VTALGEAIRPGRALGRGPEPPQLKKGTFWIVPLVGMGCVLIFLFSTMLRESTPGTTLPEAPPEVVGRWVTTDARYVDRGLRIGARDIVLEVGADQPILRGEILVVSIREEDQLPVVYIEYDTGEGPMVMEMILDEPDRMHLRNPSDVIWTRARW